MPQALITAGLATQFIPTLVGLPRYLSGSNTELAAAIERAVGKAAYQGLAELDHLEGRLSALPSMLQVARRSRLSELLRLDLAYPGLRIPAIAKLFGISPQGAAKIAQQAKAMKAGNCGR